MNLGRIPSNVRRPGAPPTEAELRQQAAQGGGLETVRDRLSARSRRDEALRFIARRLALVQIGSEAGRVTAPSKKKG